MKKAEPKKAPNERRLATFTTELLVELTQEELISKGKMLAQCEIDLRNEEQHAEAVKKDLKMREGLLLVKRSTIAGVVRSGKEPRPVLVEAWARYREGVYEEVRQDTGEVLQQTRRRLMESERQVPLPLNPADKSIGDLRKEAEELFKAKAEVEPKPVDPKPKTIGKKGRADHQTTEPADDGPPAAA